MKGFYNSIRLKKETLRFFYDNSRLIFMALFLLLGVLFGVVMEKNNWFSGMYDPVSVFSDFVSTRMKMSAFGVFLSSLCSNLIFLLLSYFCGAFLFGKPLCFFVPFFKGLGIGCVCSAAYSVLGVNGVAFSALIILPGGLISSLTLLFSCLSAYDISAKLYKDFFKGEGSGFPELFKKYCFKYIKYISIMSMSSLTECAVTSLFLSAFSM